MKIVSFIILTFCVSGIFAQTDLPDEQIEVIKGYEVSLIESTKIKIVPQPNFVDSTTHAYEYLLLAPSPSIAYLIPQLKPLALQPEKKPHVYPFYAKAGYGSPNSLLGALSYAHTGDEGLQWGIDLRHLSANNKKIPLQKFSDTEGRINASYQLNDKVIINGYLNGRFETEYFYGAETIPPNEESLKRAFKRYDGYIEIEQAHAPETSFNYKGFLQYLSDKDDLGAAESGYRLGGEIGSAIGGEEYPIGLKLRVDNSTLRHTEDYALNNILIQPYFDYHIGSFKFHLGGIALFSNQENEILPDLRVAYFVNNSKLTLEAGWTGQVVKNNFRFLSTYNPYINTRLDSLTNDVSRRIYAKLKGASGTFSYDLSGEYTTFKGMAFFLQNKNSPEEFDALYDDGRFIGISASVGFELLKHLDLRASFYQRIYTLDNEAKPWHRPSSELKGALTYTGGTDTYHISFLTAFRNGLPYRTVGGTESSLKPWIDLSLHADYYFMHALGAFMEVNNMAGNKSERWAGYASFGFNIKGGILFRM